MRYNCKKILLILGLALLVGGCHSHKNWHSAMNAKLEKYYAYSYRAFEPALQAADLAYPPTKLAFVVFKNNRQFHVYASNGGPWKFVKSYYLQGASGVLGPKLHSGDRQVPEGIYHIVELNPRSHYDLSMRLDYPNSFDREYAAVDHRDNLGGDIYIHGNHCSAGCLAIGNDAIRQLFPLVYQVGIQNVTVVIAPNDLRREKPIYSAFHPPWLPILYNQTLAALEQFPK